jgi:hypothetical protein
VRRRRSVHGSCNKKRKKLLTRSASLEMASKAHKPKTMSEVYSHLHEELEMRLAEAERVGYGFTIPTIIAPSAPKLSTSESLQIAA